VYFVHLPYPADDDHRELAQAVAGVISRAVRLEAGQSAS
jgi:hypothetical protein